MDYIRSALRRRLALARLALLALAGCGRCGGAPDRADAGPPPEAPLPPPARVWAFHEVRGRPPAASPQGCAPRAPAMRAEVGAGTGFVAAPGWLGTLVVADVDETGARVAGASAMRFGANGALEGQEPVPWVAPEALPRLDRTGGGRWVGAIGARGAAGAWRVGLWAGERVETVGEGDRFEAVDLRCAGEQCALLTTRLGRVAMPGAEVWAGAAGAPPAAWRRVVIEPADPDSDAHPIGVARWEGGLAVALEDRGACLFYGADGGAAAEVGRVPAPHGVVDAAGIPALTAMAHGTPVGEDGCLAAGADAPMPTLRFVQVGGGDGAEVQVPAPPRSGALRALGRGALATWIAPLGCGRDRRVVYGVRLDAAGKPAGAVIPIADAERYAVAAQGDDVDLWLQQAGQVTWLRLRCAP